jgi:hypothetical protein
VEGSQLWASWNPRRKSDAIDDFLRAKKPDNAIVAKALYRQLGREAHRCVRCHPADCPTRADAQDWLAAAGRDALGYYHERRDENRNVDLGPEHDWSSHAADAFGYLAISYEELPARKSASDRRRFDDRPRGSHWSA